MIHESTRTRPGGHGAHCQPLEIRFWSKVKADTTKPDGCWLWTGGTDGKGYPIIWHQRRARGAHRVAWELRHAQPFPDGLLACHKCDTPLCIRPDHIFPGTVLENTRDAWAKGRMRPQERRTHCMRGHAMTPDNVSLQRGKRKCRTCRSIRAKKHAETRRALAAALKAKRS